MIKQQRSEHSGLRTTGDFKKKKREIKGWEHWRRNHRTQHLGASNKINKLTRKTAAPNPDRSHNSVCGESNTSGITLAEQSWKDRSACGCSHCRLLYFKKINPTKNTGIGAS